MPFLDEVDEMGRKAGVGGMSRPVRIGIVAVASAILCLAAMGLAPPAGGEFTVEKSASSSSAASGAESAGESGGQSSAQGVFVYVVGAVNAPGVYELEQGARINDAVESAGGLAADADAAAVNLARVVSDGEQVRIPRQGEAGEAVQAGPQEAPAEGAKAAPTATQSGATGISADGKVNINTATSAELQTLPGIGEATAAKIVASRESEGPFASVEDLKRVSGIGEKKYAALAESITA